MEAVEKISVGVIKEKQKVKQSKRSRRYAGFHQRKKSVTELVISEQNLVDNGSFIPDDLLYRCGRNCAGEVTPDVDRKIV